MQLPTELNIWLQLHKMQIFCCCCCCCCVMGEMKSGECHLFRLMPDLCSAQHFSML